MITGKQDPAALAANAGAIKLFLRYGIGFLFNIVGTIVIVRTGGPELWGSVAVSQVVLTVFALLSHGCWGYLIQVTAAPDRSTIGNCYTLQTLLSIAWSALVLAFMPLLVDRLSSHALFLLVLSSLFGGFFYGWRYVVCGLSERDLKYSVATVAELTDIIVFNCIAVSCALAGRPYEGLVAGNMLRGIVSTFVALRMSSQRLFFAVDNDILSRIWKFSIPYTSFIALQWLPVYAGPVVAGSMLGIRELGILQLAYKTMEYPRVLVTIAFRLSMSIFSRSGKADIKIQDRLNNVLKLMYFALLPAMCILVALSPLWIPVVYGNAWIEMSKVMIIIVFPYLTMAMMMIMSSLLSARGNSKAAFIFYGVYNFLYWPVLFMCSRSLGFFGPPLTEWIALTATLVLVWQVKASGVGSRLIINYSALLLAASGATLLAWYIARHRTLTETLFAVIIMTVFWFIMSPVRKEILGWVRLQYAPDAERTSAPDESKK